MRTNIRSINFKSANGTDNVSAAVYYPDGEPVKAIVQIVHGMCEHIGRYHEFMLFLAHAGYAAVAHDQLGHGKTAPVPDKLGYFAPQNGYQCLIKDVAQLNQIAGSMFPGAPKFLLGHSMGSLVARLYCVKYPDSLTGAVFMGTPGPNPATGVGRVLAQRFIRHAGPLCRPPLLDKMTMGSMNKNFIPARTQKDWLTRDDGLVDKNLADPLCNFIFTASAFGDLYAMMEIASSQKWARDYPNALPTFILSGDSDPVGGFGRGVLQIYNRLLSAGVSDCTLQLYEGARHELLNEINRDEVYQDLLSWFMDHTAL